MSAARGRRTRSHRGLALLHHMTEQDGISAFQKSNKTGGKKPCFRCGHTVMVRRRKGRWFVETHQCPHGTICQRQPKGSSHVTPGRYLPKCDHCKQRNRP